MMEHLLLMLNLLSFRGGFIGLCKFLNFMILSMNRAKINLIYYAIIINKTNGGIQ